MGLLKLPSEALYYAWVFLDRTDDRAWPTPGELPAHGRIGGGLDGKNDSEKLPAHVCRRGWSDQPMFAGEGD